MPGRVVALANDGAFSLHLSPIILEELGRSLRNPRLRRSYPYSDEEMDAWCSGLREIGNLAPGPLPQIDAVCRDPDDDHVIAAAIAAKADTIVTGDKDLLVLDHHQEIRILTAKAFLAQIE
jgi:putative PIN family toxin of toxin-antitoxin system